MKKILIEKTKGKVTNVFIPNIYENGDYLSEEKINYIGLTVKVDNEQINIIKPRYSEFASLFVGDTVNVNKYIINCNYNEYKAKLKEKINLYYSHLNEENKNQIFNKYHFTKEKYGDYKKIIEYDIDI